MKTIRLCDLSKLKEVALANAFDPRIVFLARDPRGILQSRRSVFTSDNYKMQRRDRKVEKLVEDVKNVCSLTESILDTVASGKLV